MTQKSDASELRIWMADLTHTQQGVPADTFPYGIGCVASYAQSKLEFRSLIKLFRYPEKLASAIEEGPMPDVMAFGSFIWNATLQLEISKRIKEISPETIIIFGGAEFPLVETEREAYLRKNSIIDFFVNGEGEQTFFALIEAIAANNMNVQAVHGSVPSVFSIDENGCYHSGGAVQRLLDLSQVPSPYLTGVLDEFFDGKLIPVLQTNRGCPFKCTFCGVGPDHHNKVVRYSPEHIAAEVEYIAVKMRAVRDGGGRNDLYIADSNFGMYKQDVPTAHEIARVRNKYDWPDFALVSSGKNSKDRVIEVARIVGGAIRIGGSVQSLDPEVLSNIKRSNISEEELMNLPFESRNADGVVYAETILGLPGDSLEKHFSTLRVLVEAGFNLIIAHQLRMTKGAELGNVAEQIRFGMKKRFRAYPQCMGRYDMAGRDVVAAEIEEICVGNDNFDFDDYLTCRKRHLIIHLFLNHSMYAAVTRFIRANDLSVYRWIEIMCALPLEGALADFFKDFENAVRNELWDDEDELRNFLAQEGTIEKFQNGELGFNVLWTFKAIGVMNLAEELSELAFRAAMELFGEAEGEVEQYQAFLENALRYHTCQLSNLFKQREAVPEADIEFDIDKYINSDSSDGIGSYRFDKIQSLKFVLSEDQHSTFERYVEVYKTSPHGIGRMMAKVFTNKILRHPVPVGHS